MIASLKVVVMPFKTAKLENIKKQKRRSPNKDRAKATRARFLPSDTPNSLNLVNARQLQIRAGMLPKGPRTKERIESVKPTEA